MILIKNILISLLYFIKKEKIILINEAAGLGDYLWVRNYFKLIKNDDKYKNYKIALCATERWLDFAMDMDSDYVDIFLPFKNPYKPKILELIPLIIFKFEVFINFRASSKNWETITNTVSSKTTYTDRIFRNNNLIYPNLYDRIMAQFLPNIVNIEAGGG